jgi:hypothetical protein
MGDLAPRPRGGWQVGRALARTARTIAERRLNDLASDVYTVTRRDGKFVVRHFPTAAPGARACCAIVITPRPGESESDALARADRYCQDKHRRTD